MMKDELYDIADRLLGYSDGEWHITKALRVGPGYWIVTVVEWAPATPETKLPMSDPLYRLSTRLLGFKSEGWSIVKAKKNSVEESWELELEMVTENQEVPAETPEATDESNK